MKKLRLDRLTVDSFPTAAPAANARGTVVAYRTLNGCPDSWDGTCWLSCWDTCFCDTYDCAV